MVKKIDGISVNYIDEGEGEIVLFAARLGR